MTPYYQDDAVALYAGDCETVIPSLAGAGIEIVITSPPYNLGRGLDDELVESMHDRRSKSRRGRAANKMTASYNSHVDALPQAEYVAWQRRVLRSCWELLPSTGAIFYNHKPRSQAGIYRTPLEIVPPEIPVWQVIIWDRVERAQSYTERAFVSACEWIVVLAKPDFRLKSRAHSAPGDVWRIHPQRYVDHPCPFPVDVPARILEASRVEGVVFDPFAGSGTTLAAAKAAGLRSVGVEIDSGYCDLAVRRVAQESLFGAWK